MIHVILCILKILGIIILVLLGIILLTLLAVLIIPVRGRISGYYKDKSKDVYIKVDLSWLFHFALYRFVYRGGIQENNFKVLGKKLYPREDKDKSHKKKNKKSRAAKKSGADREPDKVLAAEENSVTNYLPNGEDENAENVSCDKHTDFNEAADSIETKESFFEKIKKRITAILYKVRLFFTGLRDKIRNKYKNIKYKWTGFIKKATDIRSFINESENIEAVKDVFIGIKNLLIHMRPRKMRIKGVIGFEDPALTGQIFGILGIMYPYYSGSTNVTASFNEPVIDIEFDVKGRLTLVYAVFIMARLLGNKTIRKWVFRK